MSFHSGQTFTFGETPSATKWNYLWENDYALADGTGISDGVIGNRQVAAGFCVQVVGNQTGAVATGTTTIPQDDTIPQNTEGDQYLSQAITPKATTNVLVIEAIIYISTTVTGQNMGMALFQDSTANALAAAKVRTDAGGTRLSEMVLRHKMTAGTTSSTTFKIRAGGNGSGTNTLNGEAATRQYGGVLASGICIREYKA